MSISEDNEFEITELFSAKAGNDCSRYFYGTIVRENDENGYECLVRGKINIKTPNHDGYIIATAKDQLGLSMKLDELVLLVLDYNLHAINPMTNIISGNFFQLN